MTREGDIAAGGSATGGTDLTCPCVVLPAPDGAGAPGAGGVSRGRGAAPDDAGMLGFEGAPCGPSAASDGPGPAATLRFRVDRMEGGEFSLLGGVLHFATDGAAALGGQGFVTRVRPADSRGPHYALKVFSQAADARGEWDMLVAHADDRTVALPYALGLVSLEDSGVSASELAPFLAGACERWGIVMEFIEGRRLSDVLADAAARARLCAEDALRIMAPIVRFAANSCNSRRADVHRDIKPRNIIVMPDGTARLIDFGIAANARRPCSARGTRYYAPPEVRDGGAHGEDLGDVRVDSYGICATLYACLHDDGEPPAYERRLRESDAPLRHDRAFVESLAGKVAGELAERFSMPAAAARERAGQAVSIALARMDARINAAVESGLSARQDMRPTPAQLESALPLVPEYYEYQLVSEAVQEGLRLAMGQMPAAAAADAAPDEPREFIDALDAFNSGRYAEAVPILRAHAARKNLSATYYLGVCVRDGLGVDACDPQQVAWLFSEAARQGNVLAQFALGRIIYEGDGVPKNEERGISWVRAAARDDARIGRVGLEAAKAWLSARGISREGEKG